MATITGNKDGRNGRNESYNIGSRKNVPRKKAIIEVKKGNHPDYHVFKINGQEYIRDNPDHRKRDNVNYQR